MSTIKCRVEECFYNNSDICQASTIEVKSRTKDHIVSNTDDTACETFASKTKKS
ncbi:hypothetical protein GGQ84_002283 [Desulfitispora alkaliphila]|uniref:DUF1540 domain-containing protein n=1 Tax=Desulfitispora alkaliphila TaxID=622674 RepID=UPI003D1ADB61